MRSTCVKAVLLLLLLAAASVSVCADTIVITPDNYALNGWAISATRGTNPDPLKKSITRFDPGAGSTPGGLGSFYMKVFYWDRDTLPKIYLGTNNHSGIELSRITNFRYYTYLKNREYGTSGTPNGQPPMIELITDSGASAQQRRWWYKPYGPNGDHNVALNQWQEWDLMSSAGRWELMNTSSTNYFGDWNWLKARYGNVKIATPYVGDYDDPLDAQLRLANKTGTGLSIKIGSGHAQDSRYDGWWRESCTIEAHTDKLVIGIDGVDTVYDFEPSPKPTVHISNKSTLDPIMANAKSNFFFSVFGKMTTDYYDLTTFSMNDGSGVLKIVAPEHYNYLPFPSETPTYLRVWGFLDTSVYPPQLTTRIENVQTVPAP